MTGSFAIAQTLGLIALDPNPAVILTELNFCKAQAAANISLSETAASIGSERDAKRYHLRAARYGACADILETAYWRTQDVTIVRWEDFCRKDAGQ